MQRPFARASRKQPPTLLLGTLIAFHVRYVWTRLHVGLPYGDGIIPFVLELRASCLDMLIAHVQGCRPPLLPLSPWVAEFLKYG